MGTIIILIGGFIGAGSAGKKPFLLSWVFLVNLCISMYIGLFAAPLIVPMLEIPGLDPGYKIAFSVFGVMFVSMIILYKAVDSIFPNREVALDLPLTAEKIGNLVVGFLAGSMVVSLVIYGYCLCPFSAYIESPGREPLKIASGKSILRMVRVINILSIQSLSIEGERYLQVLGVMPPPPPPPPPKPRPPKKASPANKGAAPAAPAGGTEKNPAKTDNGGVVPVIVSPTAQQSSSANGTDARHTVAGKSAAAPDPLQRKPSPKASAGQTPATKDNPEWAESLKKRTQAPEAMAENRSVTDTASQKPPAADAKTSLPAPAGAPPESRSPEIANGKTSPAAVSAAPEDGTARKTN